MADSPLQEPYRYSKTFIPSGKELPKERLGEVMGWEVFQNSSLFNMEGEHPYDFYNPYHDDSSRSILYVSRLASLLTHFPDDAITGFFHVPDCFPWKNPPADLWYGKWILKRN